MKAVAKSIQWMLENFMGPILVGIVLLYVSRESVDSLFLALSTTGIGFIAWLYADAALPHWRLGALLFTCLVIVLIQLFVFRLQARRLRLEKEAAEEVVAQQKQEMDALKYELVKRQSDSGQQNFEPDRFEAMVLRYFWDSDYDVRFSASNISAQTTFNTNQSAVILEKLYALGLLEDTYGSHGRLFFLSEKGRQFAAEMVKSTEKNVDWVSSPKQQSKLDYAKLSSTMGDSLTQQSSAAIGTLLDGLASTSSEGAKPKESDSRNDAIDLASVIQSAYEQSQSSSPSPTKISVRASDLQAAIRDGSIDQELRPLEQKFLRYFAANPHTRYSGNSMRHYHQTSASDAAQVLLDLCNKGLINIDTSGTAKTPLGCLYLITSKGMTVAKTIR